MGGLSLGRVLGTPRWEMVRLGVRCRGITGASFRVFLLKLECLIEKGELDATKELLCLRSLKEPPLLPPAQLAGSGGGCTDNALFVALVLTGSCFKNPSIQS